MGTQEERLMRARAKPTDINLDVPVHLKGDSGYEWMAKQMNHKKKPEAKAWTLHSRLAVMCNWYGGFRVSKARGQRVVSYATTDARRKRIIISFEDLWKLGFRIQDPRNLNVRHIEQLVTYWTGLTTAQDQKEPRKPLSASTIQNRLSALRTVCLWLNKHDVVKKTSTYATASNDLKRSGIADRDKSWNGNNVDFEEVLAKVTAEQPEVGMQLLMMNGFGLRIKEAVCFDTRQLHSMNDTLWVADGTKGGLGRAIPITTDRQREILAIIHGFASNRPHIKHLGLHERDLKQSLNRSYAVLRKIRVSMKGLGITVHGLRHQFAHQIMETAGLSPPIKGGAMNQMPQEKQAAIKKYVSGILGHSRPSITAAYIGADRLRAEIPTILTHKDI